jgi:hypothetical protein
VAEITTYVHTSYGRGRLDLTARMALSRKPRRMLASGWLLLAKDRYDDSMVGPNCNDLQDR